MAIEQGLTTSYRKEIHQAIHNLLVDSVKVALYDNDASIGKSTTAYSTTNEVSGTGYTAGGQVVSGITIDDDNDVVFIDFDNPEWSGTTLSAAGALLYNASQSNRSIAVIDFRGVISTVAEVFRIALPSANAAQAIIKIQ